jgi:hypothetical protein
MGTVTLLAAAQRSSARCTHMTNFLEQAINTDDGIRAAKLIQNALGIESDGFANYCSRRHGPRIVNSALGSSAIG